MRDWYPTAPDVFIASAISNAGRAGFRAAADFAEDKFTPGSKVHIGLGMTEAVSLAMAPNVPDSVRAEIANLADKIGRIFVRHDSSNGARSVGDSVIVASGRKRSR